MKTRDRVVSALVVGGIIGGIWFFGAKLRSCGEGGETKSDAAPTASVSASASASTSTSATAVASASASTIAIVDAAPPMSGACKAMMDASQKKLDDAKSARACTPSFDTAQLECHTSSNGATWGLRVDDVVDLGAEPCKTGWLVRLVHLDVNGAEAAIVPGVSQNQRAHTYNVAIDMKLQDVLFFDWDGDGDDEVFVRGIRGTGDQPDEERAQVWSFQSGDAGSRVDGSAAGGTSRMAIAPFAPSSSFTIIGTQDVDADGRPDLMVTFFGTGKDAPPTSRRFAAHSLKDGSFSVKDTAAVTWAEKQCPSEPTLDLSQFDGAVADAMVCAEIWGHDLSKACAGKSCPPWAQKLAKTKPPLTLK
jgi:hypothetical protein